MRLIPLNTLVAVLLCPALAHAFDETLHFRLNAGGEVVAVIAGKGDTCSPQYFDPTSVTKGASDFVITSGGGPDVCFLSIPTYDYELSVNLGALAAEATYQVTWKTDSLSVSGTVTPGTLPAASTVNYSALWWNPSESGWGVNINHQDDTLFLVYFSYGADGKPTWLVAPNMPLHLDGSFGGAVYVVHQGPPFDKPWAPVQQVDGIGFASMRFASDSTGTLTLDYEGGDIGEGAASRIVTKSIQKEIFVAPTACTQAKGSRATLTNYQDMWWNPNEPGWGLSLSHQGSVILAVLFTYDAGGKSTWFVGPDLARQADGSFSGSLYSTKGPVLDAAPWTPITANAVGSMSLQFSDGQTGSLSYTVNGSAVAKQVQREVAGSLLPHCQ